MGKSNRRSHCFGPSEGSKPGGSIDDVFGFLRINSGVKVAGNSLDIGEHAVITGSVADSENVVFNPETLFRSFPEWQVAATQPDNILPVPDKPVYLHR